MLLTCSIFAVSINQSSNGMKSYNKKFVYFICLVSAMGGLLFGYDWVVIGGAKPFYELYFDIADVPAMQGLAMSVALLGCLIGAMVAGMMADRYGRKPLLIISASWNGQMGWRWMFWAAAFPAAIFLLLACFIPESPRWLAMKGKEEKAWNVLSKIGGDDYADQELRLVEETGSSKSEGGLRLLFSRPFRKVLVLGIIVAVFQQWCGTNVIFNYAQEIFQSAGYSLGDVLFNIVVTGVANVVFTFVAIYTVERLGRRALMLLGAGGLAGIYLILGTCYFFEVSGFFMVVLVVLAIACYAMSLGPITWVLLAEIFPNRVRAVAMATCTFALWVGSFTLTYTFPLLNNFLGSSGTFWIYAVICAVGYLFFFRALPETKGKSLEALEKDLIK